MSNLAHKLIAPEHFLPRRTPVGPIEADEAHPHLRGCIAWYPSISHEKDLRTGKLSASDGGIFPREFDGQKSLYYDQVDNEIHTNLLMNGIGAFSCWVRPTHAYKPSAGYVLIGTTGDPGGNVFRFRYNGWSSYWDMVYRGGYGATVSLFGSVFTNDASLQVWQNVVLNWDYNGIFEIYQDGELDNSSASTSSDWANTSSDSLLDIGSTNGGQFYDGYIQNVRIYNRTLSAQEIKSMYLDPWAPAVPAGKAMPFAEVATGSAVPVLMHHYES